LILVAFGSIILAGYRLCQPGVSKTVRSLIIKQHILYIIVFIVCNMYIVLVASDRNNFIVKNP